MIAISSVTQDTAGSVVFSDKRMDYKENTARISRIKTLDGGVYITNSGVSDGDRTLNVSAKITEAQAIILWHIFETYTFIYAAISDGVFYAAISGMAIKNGVLEMTILIKSKENI